MRKKDHFKQKPQVHFNESLFVSMICFLYVYCFENNPFLWSLFSFFTFILNFQELHYIDDLHSQVIFHCIKYQNVCAEILLKRTVSAEFPQNLYHTKLGEMTVFYAVFYLHVEILPSNSLPRGLLQIKITSLQ